MFYIWFWVHWLAEQAQKFVQYQFTKLGRITSTDFKEGVKIIWKFVFLSRKQVIRKKQTIVWKEENKPKCLCVILGALVGIAPPPKSVQYQFTKLGRVTATDPKKGANIILKLIILTRRPALRKNQGGQSNREKLREWLVSDPGYTGWQSALQNLLNINLLNLVCWFHETLRKEQKLFSSDSF